ncbi:MAG: amidohydrolase family protein, partial [Vulcanimicrobiaceae bacterium]
RWFAERSSWRLTHPTEPADVAAALRAHGVERFVFCSYAHRPGIARSLNTWLAQTSRELDGYGLPLATVHPDDPEYLDDLRYALADGCIGLKLHEDVQKLNLDDERLTPVFRTLEPRCFVLVHVGPTPWRTDPAARDSVERVLERHPQLPFVVAHMGYPDAAAYFALMPRYPNLYLDTTMGFAAESPMKATVNLDDLERHAGRVLYGTDYPNIGYDYDGEITALRSLRLSDGALQKIVHDNALRLIERSLA